MYISIRTLLMLPFASALVIGCSDSTKSLVNQTSELGPNDEVPTVLTKFDGSYLGGCEQSDEEDPTDGFEIISSKIDGDSGSIKAFNYTDEACATPDMPAETVLELSIAYPGGTVQTALGTADFIDITPESITFDGQAPTPEQMQLLGQSGAFDTYFDIVLIDGSSLYLGDDSGELDGETAAKRPNTLESVAATRQ